MISVVYTVLCDGCGWWDYRTVSDESRADALRKSKAAGWKIIHSPTARQLCLACAGKIPDPRRNP